MRRARAKTAPMSSSPPRALVVGIAGGGGTGKTNDSALALLGGGVNEKENREDHGVAQSTGDSGPTLPEEFRSGLDEYFNRLERRPAGQ